jgi:hypothetical protein
MSAPLIIITGLIYAYIGLEQLYKGNVGGGIMYAGYAFANVGLFMAVK